MIKNPLLLEKRGRPLKGYEKRVRTSLTLSPTTLSSLRRQASISDQSISDVIEEIVSKAERTQSKISSFKRWNELPSGVIIPYEKLLVFAGAYGIKRLSLFGSVLNDKFTQDSDIDVLLEFTKDKTPSLFELSKMEDELKKIFCGKRVEIKTPCDLSPLFREQVLSSSKVIYSGS